MVLSTGVPSLADKRYFLSQMSSEASWKGIASTSLCSSLTTLFMDGYLSPEVLRTVFSPKKPEPEKRTTLPVVATVCVVRTAVRQPPFLSPVLPIIKMSRHNILCWGRKPKFDKTARQETSLS